MASFQNPPSQRLSELQDQRAKLMVLVDTFIDFLLVDYENIARYPWDNATNRSHVAAQLSACELSVGRIDREIAVLKAEMDAPEASDETPQPQPEVQPFVAHT